MDKAGLESSRIPTIKVIIPKAKVQPQLSKRSLLTIENKTSDRPPKIKDSANKIESVIKEPIGDINAKTLTTTKKTPTSKGIYQCLITSFTVFKNNVCIVYIFK